VCSESLSVPNCVGLTRSQLARICEQKFGAQGERLSAVSYTKKQQITAAAFSRGSIISIRDLFVQARLVRYLNYTRRTNGNSQAIDAGLQDCAFTVTPLLKFISYYSLRMFFFILWRDSAGSTQAWEYLADMQSIVCR